MASPLEHLNFEKPVMELDSKLHELRRLSSNSQGELDVEIQQLEKKRDKLINSIYSNLNESQIVQIARHPRRPYTLDYVEKIFTDFEELHGDRQCSDDASIIAGIGRLGKRAIAIVGHQKGHNTEEKIKRNFGMPRPEGYRKAARVFKLAERFAMPILTFIDTPGAYPGVDAEERNQSGAIADNLSLMSSLRVPIISVIIGEGGSGGALAIAVCDYLMILQYSTYSVISPEGCASILWKDAGRSAQAAQAMGVTANKLKELKLVDEIIEEPNGGAHRNIDDISRNLALAVERQLSSLDKLSPDDLVEQRYQKLTQVGVFVNG